MSETILEILEPRSLLTGSAIPRFDHVVVVVEENHSYSEIVQNTQAPYINHLRAIGAYFTHAHGVTHPSQPNYLDLFSGSNQGTLTDTPPAQKFHSPNLGGELFAAGLSFKGYSESMPVDGYEGVGSGTYQRKHNPWVDFSDLPAGSNLTFNRFPHDTTGFKRLPTVSFVAPNLNNDMHDGSIATADSWLRSNVAAYVHWARTHNSLLIVTWDEDDLGVGNRIPTIFVGANVRVGRSNETINHFNILRTIEQMYGLAPTGAAATAKPITDVWMMGAPAAHAADFVPAAEQRGHRHADVIDDIIT